MLSICARSPVRAWFLLHLALQTMGFQSVGGHRACDGAVERAAACYVVDGATGFLTLSDAAPSSQCEQSMGGVFLPCESDPTFRLKSIWQRNPLASCSGTEEQRNTLVVALWLQEGKDLLGSSVIKLSGFKGAVTGSGSISLLDSCMMQGGLSTSDGNKCFLYSPMLSHNGAAWTDAEAACAEWGGNLASIESAEENSLVEAVMQDESRAAWIGYTDLQAEGIWVWSDGSDASFTDWQVGEPNDAYNYYFRDGEDCATFAPGHGWNDRACATALPFLCSKRIPTEELFCSGAAQGLGEWDRDSLILRLCPNAVMDSSQQFFFSFEVNNPSTAQASPTIFIELIGSVEQPRVEMHRYGPLVEAAGIAGAADPLLIVDRCSTCARGRYWAGLDGCLACPEGTYSDEEDAVRCQACPLGSTSAEGSTSYSDCTCAQGYMSSADDNGQRKCVFCNSSVTLSGPSGSFSDGSGDSEYLGGQHCSWTIEATHGWKVVLDFELFSTLQHLDFVDVHECSDPSCISPRLLARLTGPLVPSSAADSSTDAGASGFMSATGILRVEFVSAVLPDYLQDRTRWRGDRAGFRATWRTPPPAISTRALFRIDPGLACPGIPVVHQPPEDSSWPDSRLPPSRSPNEPPSQPGRDDQMPQQEGVQLEGGPHSASMLVLRVSFDSPRGLEGDGQVVLRRVGELLDISDAFPRVSIRPEESDPCTAGGGQRVAGKCFQMIERYRRRTWAEAERLCQSWGGNLASVGGHDDSNALSMLLKSANVWGGAWIGLHLPERAAGFEWSDRSREDFSDWGPTGLSRAGNCTALTPGMAGGWHWERSACDVTREYVCSKLLPTQPRPINVCADGREGHATWDAELLGGTLGLTLCAGETLDPGTVYLIAVNGTNPELTDVSGVLLVEVSGSISVEETTSDSVMEVPACLQCPMGHYQRWSWFSQCSPRCSAQQTPQLHSLLCMRCPAGSTSPIGSSSTQQCVCNAGYEMAASGSCRVCPEGSFCSGLGGSTQRCPGNTSSAAGSSLPSHCSCSQGYALSASPVAFRPPATSATFPAHPPSRPLPGVAPGPPSNASAAAWCLPCPTNHFCAGWGTAQACPPGGESAAGAASMWDCEYCKTNTVLQGASGNVTDGSSLRQHRCPTACSWIIRPRGATKVMLTMGHWGSAAGQGGMALEVRACADAACSSFEPIATMTGTAAAPAAPIESPTGIMELVFSSVGACSLRASDDKSLSAAEQAASAGPERALAASAGTFSAWWTSEPSLASKSMRQTNPFASCGSNTKLLHTNTLLLNLQFRASLALAAEDASAITISGLRGAVVAGSQVAVQAGEVSDACLEAGGVRVDGDAKCFMMAGEFRTWDDADAECRRWGGALACVASSEERQTLSTMLQDKHAAMAWVGHFYDRGQAAWGWGAGCASEWVPPLGRTSDGDCASVGQRGDLVAVVCGARLPSVCSKQLPRVENMEPLFCSGGHTGVGDWRADDANGTLLLTLCEGHSIKPNTNYLLAFAVTNPSTSQESPDIRIAASGSFTIPSTPVDKPPRTRGATGILGADHPLKIIGGGGESGCALPGSGSSLLGSGEGAGPGANAANSGDDEEKKTGRYTPEGNVTLMVCAGALAMTITGVCGYLCWHGVVSVPTPPSDYFDSLRSFSFMESFSRSKPKIRMEGDEMDAL